MSVLFQRRYYRYAFVVVIFLNTLNLEFFGIPFYLFEVPMILWGITIFIVDAIKSRLAFKQYHLWLLLGYLFCLFLATRANTSYATTTSYLMLVMQFLIFTLLYANPKGRALIDIKKEMRGINKITCGLTFVASAISLLMFLFNMTLTRNGTSIGLIGGNRLFGIYFNSNPASFLACMSIVFSLISIRNKTKCPIFYYSNILVQFFFILLGNCRAALIILLIMVVMMMYYTIFKRKEFNRTKKIITVCIVSVMFYFGTDIAQRVLYIIPELQGAQVEETGGRFQLDKVFQVISLVQDGAWENRREIYTLTDQISSSRISLWTTSYKLWKTSPIVGVGMDTLQPMARALYPDVSVFHAPQVVHTHNAFVEALVTAGIAGFVLFLLFFLDSAMALVEVMRKYSYTKSYLIVLLILFVLMSEFVGGMLDYGIFYTYSLSATLFWVYLGYLQWINHMPLLKLVQEHREYDFVSYDLEYVDYHRLKKDEVKQVSVHVIEANFIKEELCAITIAVAILFGDEKLSLFQYTGHFELDDDVEKNQATLQKYRDDMALEVYEIIKDDIEVLVSDSRGEVKLPPVSHQLLKEV